MPQLYINPELQDSRGLPETAGIGRFSKKSVRKAAANIPCVKRAVQRGQPVMLVSDYTVNGQRVQEIWDVNYSVPSYGKPAPDPVIVSFTGDFNSDGSEVRGRRMAHLKSNCDQDNGGGGGGSGGSGGGGGGRIDPDDLNADGTPKTTPAITIGTPDDDNGGAAGGGNTTDTTEVTRSPEQIARLELAALRRLPVRHAQQHNLPYVEVPQLPVTETEEVADSDEVVQHVKFLRRENPHKKANSNKPVKPAAPARFQQVPWIDYGAVIAKLAPPPVLDAIQLYKPIIIDTSRITGEEERASLLKKAMEIAAEILGNRYENVEKVNDKYTKGVIIMHIAEVPRTTIKLDQAIKKGDKKAENEARKEYDKAADEFLKDVAMMVVTIISEEAALAVEVIEFAHDIVEEDLQYLLEAMKIMEDKIRNFGKGLLNPHTPGQLREVQAEYYRLQQMYYRKLGRPYPDSNSPTYIRSRKPRQY